MVAASITQRAAVRRLATVLLLAASLSANAGDIDADGVPDSVDNCSLIANPAQRNTDGDGFGNRCDPDFDNSGLVNFIDLNFMKAVFFGTDADADLDGDGRVNFADLNITKAFFFGPPGPGASCGASFAAYPPLIANQACPTPGEDCDSVLAEFTISLSECGGADRVELWVDGLLAAIDSNPTAGSSTLTALLSDGNPVVEGLVLAGPNVLASTGAIELSVDLHDPATAFVSPPDGSSVVYGLGDDQDPAPGFQVALSFEAFDGQTLGSWEFVTREDGSSGAVLLAGGSFEQNPASIDRLVTIQPVAQTIEVTAWDAVGNSGSSQFEADFETAGCGVSIQPQNFFGQWVGNDVCSIPGANCDAAAIDLNVLWTCTGAAADRIELYQDGALEATVFTAPDPGPSFVAFNVPITHGQTYTFQARIFAGSTELGISANLGTSADLHDPDAAFIDPPEGAFVEYTQADDMSLGIGFQTLVMLEASDGNSPLDDWVVTEDDGDTSIELASGFFETNPQTLSNIELTLSPTIFTSFTIRAIVRDLAGNETSTEFSGVLACPAAFGPPYNSSTALLGNDVCLVPGDDCNAAAIDLEVLFEYCVGPVDRVELYRDGVLEAVASAPGPVSTSFSVPITHGQTNIFQARVFTWSIERGISADLEISADLHDPGAVFSDPPDGAVVGYTVADDASPAPGFQILVTLEASDGNSPLDDWVVTEDDGNTSIELASGFFATNPQTLSNVELTLSPTIFPNFTIRAIVRDHAGNETSTEFSGFFDI